MLTILLFLACNSVKVDADTSLPDDSDDTDVVDTDTPGDDDDDTVPGDDDDDSGTTDTDTPGAPPRIPVCGAPPDATVAAPDFATEVEPIFLSRCRSCHQSNPTGLTFNPAYGQLVNVASTQLPSMPRVAPGDLQGSYLWNKLCGTHLDVGGSGQAMPPPGAISDSEATVIAEWIVTGALP